MLLSLTATAAPTDLTCEALFGLLLALELQHQPYSLLICKKNKDLGATVLHQAGTHFCFYGEKHFKEGINDSLELLLVTVPFFFNFKRKKHSHRQLEKFQKEM